MNEYTDLSPNSSPTAIPHAAVQAPSQPPYSHFGTSTRTNERNCPMSARGS